jgi:hypothetical protein
MRIVPGCVMEFGSHSAAGGLFVAGGDAGSWSMISATLLPIKRVSSRSISVEALSFPKPTIESGALKSQS